MNNVAEFVKVRQEIESLAVEINALVEGKTMPRSKTKLDEATELLIRLTEMADNDVQQVAVGRLTRLLAKLGMKVQVLGVHKRVVKKHPVS
jgi:hypothetical protein